jgi:hypothetical protein
MADRNDGGILALGAHGRHDTTCLLYDKSWRTSEHVPIECLED